KARYKAINQKLSELSSRFQNNLLDATNAWSKLVTDESELAGIPDSAKSMFAQNAANKDKQGWLVTLEFPSVQAVLTHADSRELRREVYEAFSTRASDQGPHAGQFDNGPLIEEILALRHEQANLVGFANYAEYSVATKMAEDTDKVMAFLEDLAKRARPAAQREFAELGEFAAESLGIDGLEAWDVNYASEKLRQARYQLSQEDLRPYFSAPKVIAGLFQVVERLFGVSIEERQGVETWHADVTFYDVLDAGGELVASFYLDPYAREHKRGGAWMDECTTRMRVGDELDKPVAYLVCNFTPPVDGKPALLTHDEVTTLFHEAGHGFHHMLTRIDYPAVSGINGVEWDAVELPSQFLENWCWEREALDLFARHHETGEPLPGDLFDKMIAARNFQSAMFTVRQLEFALFDFRLHRDYDPANPTPVMDVLSAVRAEVSVVVPPAFNRFPHAFGHIFAGGYAAGYYSYKWAEVLSADAFSAFEEAGVFDADTGERFRREVLEVGGSRPAMESFKAFRGREPELDALLRHTGIAA
ncbi:MAG: M3 family metallopeptidase, partial [Gammaproteobacteria bacterium]